MIGSIAWRLLGSWVFRTNVTADFGIVTGNFGPS
jgi:hypothetical protein